MHIRNYDTKTNNIEFVPIYNTQNGIALAKGEEAKKIMSQFEARNIELQNGEWKKGWNDFCNSKKNDYLEVIRAACLPDSQPRENHMFAHYLDCEAHTDVWRELFPTYNQTNEK